MHAEDRFYWGLNMLSAGKRLYGIAETYPRLDKQLEGFGVHRVFLDPSQHHRGLLPYYTSAKRINDKGETVKVFLAVASRPLHCSSERSFMDCLLCLQRWARRRLHQRASACTGPKKQ